MKACLPACLPECVFVQIVQHVHGFYVTQRTRRECLCDGTLEAGGPPSLGYASALLAGDTMAAAADEMFSQEQ